MGQTFIRKAVILCSLIFCLAGKTGAQLPLLEVYPGDANNNGVVNNIDFLYLGLAYDFFGPPRDNTLNPGLLFLPILALPWPLNIGNGTNAAYADTDGNGTVNYDSDAPTVYQNYGEKRPGFTADSYPPGNQGSDPQLYFDESAVSGGVESGQVFSMPLLFGTETIPVEDLYGIAFSVIIDAPVVDSFGVAFDFTDTTWANSDGDQAFMFTPVSNKRTDVAWTRTDQNMRSGYGPFGNADFIIIIDVVGLQQQVIIRIDSIKMIDKYGNSLAVAGDTATITVLADAAPAGNSSTEKTVGNIYPNPAGDYLFYQFDYPVEHITLLDALGRVVRQTSPHDRSGELQLSGLPDGYYRIEVQTRQEVMLKPIIIRH